MAENSINPKLDTLLQKVRGVEERLGRIEHLAQTDATEAGAIAVKVDALKEDIQRLAIPSGVRKFFRVLTGSVAALATFLGIYGSLYLFRFDTSVDAYGTLNPKDPFETRFAVSNESPYSIYHVRYLCTISHAEVSEGPNPLAASTGVNVDITEILELDSHGKRSLRCNYPFGNGDKVKAEAILEIQVGYRPFRWLRFSRSHTFTFGLKRTSTGDALWLPLENYTSQENRN